MVVFTKKPVAEARWSRIRRSIITHNAAMDILPSLEFI
jgi:hypothetical protein